MPWWFWLLISFAALVAVWVGFVLRLAAAGRRDDARALATFIPDRIVLVTRLTRDPRLPRRRKLLLLGLGSTLAVCLHAALQWWGARRTGVALRPRPGWRDPEVMRVVRRAVRSVIQAGLLALQLLAVMLAANTVAGGTVALQIAFNFYYLPIALAAAPVGLAVLPRLSRLYRESVGTGFNDTYRQGLTLALFLVVPAACGYVLLSGQVARVDSGDDQGASAMRKRTAVEVGAR